MFSSNRRVVVTGMGLVSPLANGADLTWSRLIDGKSGIGYASEDVLPHEDMGIKIAGVVPKGDEPGFFNPNNYGKTSRMDLFIIYALAAAQEAAQSANLENLSEEQKMRFGVSVGSGIGGFKVIEDNILKNFNGQHKRISPFFLPATLINLASGNIAMKYGLQGPNISIVTACATATHSIGDSFLMIKAGMADGMLCGGSEAPLAKTAFAGFARMGALSTKHNDRPQEASRPWDRDRDGFVMSEGAGVLILEELESAKKRGSNIIAEVVGYGASGDAHHITSPKDDGDGAYRCMKSAIEMAGLNTSDIGYINAHGTSTSLGDVAEMTAIRRVMGNDIDKVKVSSTKSSVGHLLGGAGALEAAFAIKAIQDSVIPPTLNLHNPDEICSGIDMVPFKAKECKLNYTASNSFGFGGTNSTIVFAKYK